jgi:hypothetical protein
MEIKKINEYIGSLADLEIMIDEGNEENAVRVL